LASIMRRWRAWRGRAVFHWVVVGGVTVLLAAAVGTTIDRAERLAASYGERRTVAVASRTLDPGEVIGPADVEIIELPLAAAPPDAMADEVVGRVVRERVLDGEAVRRARLAEHARDGITALMDPGERAIAVPKAVAPKLEPGDHVEVIGPGGLDTNATVLGRGRVLAVDDTGTVIVAVTQQDAPTVAAAAADGHASLALLAPED
jgi:Flp pilus assembly protein CpaB